MRRHNHPCNTTISQRQTSADSSKCKETKNKMSVLSNNSRINRQFNDRLVLYWIRKGATTISQEGKSHLLRRDLQHRCSKSLKTKFQLLTRRQRRITNVTMKNHGFLNQNQKRRSRRLSWNMYTQTAGLDQTRSWLKCLRETFCKKILMCHLTTLLGWMTRRGYCRRQFCYQFWCLTSSEGLGGRGRVFACMDPRELERLSSLEPSRLKARPDSSMFLHQQ